MLGNVAVGPRFPIGYKKCKRRWSKPIVAVGPRFPIGYKPKPWSASDDLLRLARVSPSAISGGIGGPGSASVAVGPRFPIGYKATHATSETVTLRLARVSPSAIRCVVG